MTTYITKEQVEEIKKDFNLNALTDRQVIDFYCNFIKQDEHLNPKEITILYM